MEERSLWFGVGIGMCTSVLVLGVCVIDNDFERIAVCAISIFSVGIMIIGSYWFGQKQNSDTGGV